MRATEPLKTAVVYTTRLERMSFMKSAIISANVSEIFNDIIKESKPKLKPLRKPRRSKRLFKMLLAIIDEINEKLRHDRKQTDETYICKTDVTLKYYEPFTIDLTGEKGKNGANNNYKQFDSIMDEIQKYLVASRNSKDIYFLIKDRRTAVSDIYLPGKGEGSEYYRLEDEDLFPESRKRVVTLQYCCWYDRRLKLELFYKYFLLEMPTFLKTAHDCEGACKCCCSQYPDSDIFQYHTDVLLNNQINSRKNRILNLISHTPSKSSVMNVINQSLKYVPKISRKLATDVKRINRNTKPISIKLIDHCNKKITYYEIGANGHIDTYLKAYPVGVGNTGNNGEQESQPCIINNTQGDNTTDLPKVEYEELIYCWFARQNIFSNLVLEHHVCENTILFLKTPHTCPVGSCKCCCIPLKERRYGNNAVVDVPEFSNYSNSTYNNSPVIVSITFNNEPPVSKMTFRTYRTATACTQTTHTVGYKAHKKKTIQMNKTSFARSQIETKIDSPADIVEMTDNKNLLHESEVIIVPDDMEDPLFIKNDDNLPRKSNWRSNISINDPLASNIPHTSNINDSCGFLIKSILSKFKGIRLGLDEKGSVNIYNTAPSVWSQEDTEILNNILKLVQNEVNTFRLNTAIIQQNDVNNTTVEQPITVQTPEREDSHQMCKPCDIFHVEPEEIQNFQKTIRSLNEKDNSVLINNKHMYKHFTNMIYMHRVLAMNDIKNNWTNKIPSKRKAKKTTQKSKRTTDGIDIANADHESTEYFTTRTTGTSTCGNNLQEQNGIKIEEITSQITSTIDKNRIEITTSKNNYRKVVSDKYTKRKLVDDVEDDEDEQDYGKDMNSDPKRRRIMNPMGLGETDQTLQSASVNQN